MKFKRKVKVRSGGVEKYSSLPVSSELEVVASGSVPEYFVQTARLRPVRMTFKRDACAARAQLCGNSYAADSSRKRCERAVLDEAGVDAVVVVHRNRRGLVFK